MDRQVACAAAISSSGLVRPPESSKRDSYVTSWPLIAPLPVSNRPEPPRRSPSHVAWAFRSIAILCLLFARSGRPVVRLALQLFREEVHVKPTRVVVRVDVAGAAPQLARSRVVRVP